MKQSAGAIRILVIDDQTMFRDGVSAALGTVDGMEVVLRTGQLAEALDFLRTRAADVVLLDYDLGEERGTEFLPHARQMGFEGAVIVVTAELSAPAAAMLVRQGIAAIVKKSESLTSLVDTVRTAASGITCLDHRYFEQAKAPSTMAQTFTEREQKVIRLLLSGLGNKEIGARLALSEASVKASIRRLFEITGARTRGQLVCVVLEEYGDELR